MTNKAVTPLAPPLVPNLPTPVVEPVAKPAWEKQLPSWQVGSKHAQELAGLRREFSEVCAALNALANAFALSELERIVERIRAEDRELDIEAARLRAIDLRPDLAKLLHRK